MQKQSKDACNAVERADLVRLLVVDEGDGYFKLLQHQIEMCGAINREIECMLASTGEEALKAIAEWHPSVVVLDAHLPDMSCFEVMSQCSSSRLPLILTSRFRSSAIAEAALSKGASAYVPKTEDPDEVEELLQQVAILHKEWKAVCYH